MTKKNSVPKVLYNHNGIEVEIEEKDILKYEVAEELGVLDKALENGWKTLSAKETGKIGGLISRRKREKQNKCKS
ncbi:small, acid-soluble spore protein, alpha/beta type [[Clostridium] fimetarium]|uniref:Small, acid-soluble spore protein, alpha/beta type n=1 Tax=[Clostridium] fimetarium TaxID=99656 RepID=A0A1I0R2S7_9FIRM|nr:small, acid-soluble spore protein, alpha/beta type [[Clostridium] fimetarium]SEW34574.1 Small, acid-soluble spore protein, alpha/beta type [[Clostridium] fimetarium]